MKKVNILGVNISGLKKREILGKIEDFLLRPGQYYLVTPNPEIILKASEDEELFYILNQADLAPADGMGIKIAGFLEGENLTRFPGADLVLEILKIAEKNNLKVLVVNSSKGLSSALEIKKTLKNSFPNLNLKVVDIKPSNNFEIGVELKDFEPQILFNTFGSPSQEKFVYHILKKIPSLKLAAGVGGSFDFLTGKLVRAPKFLRFWGLEWMWRLWKQPWRVKRIIRAVMVFPYKYLQWRFIFPLVYRSNVVCLLYKKEEGKYKILIVERRDEAGHWQLPQGGTEGESLKKAGSRELNEELNIENFKPVAVAKKITKYGFPKRKKDKKTQKHWGYKGQKQSLFIAKFEGEDKDIEINYWEHRAWKWVDWKNLKQEISSVRRENTKKFLKIFQEKVIFKLKN